MNTHHAWLSRWSLKQDLAILMSVVMLVSSFTMSVASAGQPSAAEITAPLQKSYQELGAAMAGNNKGAKADPKQVADRLEKLFQLLEEAERQIPRDTFDIKAIIQKVGTDPVKLFEWVRDETYLVPYRGVLRGDKGVLMDRLGNSLDRGMLLVALLRSVGQTVQLAHGTLTEKQAKEVLQKARPVPNDGIPALRPSSAMPEGVLERVAAENQIDHAQLRKHIANLTAEQERMKESVMQRVSQQAALITAAVGKPKEDIRRKEEAAAIAAIRDHWWVQWQDGSKWVDLDATLPDVKPGQTLVSAQEMIAPDKLPASLFHEVQIRIIIEQWEGNQLKEVPVLTHNLRPSDLLGEHIALRHIPLKWPKDLDLFQEKEPLHRLKTTALAQEEWLPVLSIGDRNIMQKSFTASGDTNDNPGAPILGGGAQDLGRGVEGMLGSGRIGQSTGRKPLKESHLTAEWIDYEIRSPGHPVHKIRRQIFDFVGPAARSSKKVAASGITEAQRLDRGLILLGETEILLLVSQLSPQYVEHLTTKKMLASREVVFSVLGNKNPPNSKIFNDKLSKIEPQSSQLYSLALARREWSRSRVDVYLDRPNILSYHKNFHLGEKDEVLQRDGFDIVDNDVAVRSGSETAPFLIRLEQGVLDTNAEALVAASNCQQKPEKSNCGEVENTAEIFSRAGTQWLMISNPNDSTWKDTKLPQDVRARIDEDVAAGFSVMVPSKAMMLKDQGILGWWRVDPKSGQTLGMGPDGSGQTATEYSLGQKIIVMSLATAIGSLVCMLGTEAGGSLSDERRDVYCVLTGIGVGGALIYSAPITLGKIIFALLGAFVAGYSL